MVQAADNTTAPAWEALETLLAEAETALRRTDYGALDRDLNRAGLCLARLIAPPAAPLPAEQKQRIVATYHRLSLMGAAHQQTVQDQIQRAREGQRTLAAYAGQP